MLGDVELKSTSTEGLGERKLVYQCVFHALHIGLGREGTPVLFETWNFADTAIAITFVCNALIHKWAMLLNNYWSDAPLW